MRHRFLKLGAVAALMLAGAAACDSPSAPPIEEEPKEDEEPEEGIRSRGHALYVIDSTTAPV